jgi:hypothetical protein
MKAMLEMEMPANCNECGLKYMNAVGYLYCVAGDRPKFISAALDGRCLFCPLKTKEE